jgi:hypothetical protein
VIWFAIHSAIGCAVARLLSVAGQLLLSVSVGTVRAGRSSRLLLTGNICKPKRAGSRFDCL